jgi:hypothetical protein
MFMNEYTIIDLLKIIRKKVHCARKVILYEKKTLEGVLFLSSYQYQQK